jgi:hypothetical protein
MMAGIFNRRLRFSLRSLFVVVTVVAVLSAWMGWEASVMRSRQSARNLIEARGGFTVRSNKFRISLTRDWNEFTIWLPEKTPLNEVGIIRQALPEANISYFGPVELRDLSDYLRVRADAFPGEGSRNRSLPPRQKRPACCWERW